MQHMLHAARKARMRVQEARGARHDEEMTALRVAIGSRQKVRPAEPAGATADPFPGQAGLGLCGHNLGPVEDPERPRLKRVEL